MWRACISRVCDLILSKRGGVSGFVSESVSDVVERVNGSIRVCIREC